MRDKILVYDCSLFGQALGKFLEVELEMRVVQITDSFKPQEMSDREIFEHVSQKIKPYVGKVTEVVIASPLVVSVVAGELEKLFPKQRFVYYGRGVYEEFCDADRVAILAMDRIRRTERYQVMKAACQGIEIEELDCKRWVELMDRGWWGRERITDEFRHKLGTKVFVYHQPLLLREKRMREIIDWRGEIIDVKKRVLKSLKDGRWERLRA